MFAEAFHNFLNEQMFECDYAPPVYNKQLGGCSKKRPDVFIDFFTHVVVLEFDENQHQGYTCESKRLCHLLEDIAHRPLVVLRLNPDAYRDKKGIRFPSCFAYTEEGTLCVNETEWRDRLNIFFEEFVSHKSVIPEKTLTVKHFFYSERGDDEDDDSDVVSTGVFEDASRNRWVTERKIDGKKRRRYFSIAKYGYEKAFEMAKSCRLGAQE
jgi:hypothetical protein